MSETKLCKSHVRYEAELCNYYTTLETYMNAFSEFERISSELPGVNSSSIRQKCFSHIRKLMNES